MKTFGLYTAVLLILTALPFVALAQDASHGTMHAKDDASSTATITSLKALHDITANNLLKTAEMLDEEVYAYSPTEDVRTTGQILAHLANAQYMFCSSAAGEESPNQVNFEETATAKDDIVEALKGGFDYCAAVYDNMTDAQGSEMRPLFGREMAASGILAFNSAHNYEHYGNLVTYMRINGIVPPSSMQ